MSFTLLEVTWSVFLQKYQYSEITMAPRIILTSLNLFNMMHEEEKHLFAILNNYRLLPSL